MRLPDISDLIGTPYGYFGRDVGALSCMGLIIEVYRRAGIIMSDPVMEPDKAETEWIEVTGDWEPGDVLGMESEVPGLEGHGVFYLGAGIVVHSTPRNGVEITTVANLPRRILTAYRYANNN